VAITAVVVEGASAGVSDGSELVALSCGSFFCCCCCGARLARLMAAAEALVAVDPSAARNGLTVGLSHSFFRFSDRSSVDCHRCSCGGEATSGVVALSRGDVISSDWRWPTTGRADGRPPAPLGPLPFGDNTSLLIVRDVAERRNWRLSGLLLLLPATFLRAEPDSKLVVLWLGGGVEGDAVLVLLLLAVAVVPEVVLLGGDDVAEEEAVDDDDDEDPVAPS